MASALRIVLAGGGPAAIEAALALRDLAGDAVEIELIAPERDLLVRAYEVLSAFHDDRERRYPLAKIAEDLDLNLVRDAVSRVVPERNAVILRSGERRAYDRLVMAVGAKQLDAVGGAIRFRGSSDATRLRSLLLESRAGLHRTVAFVVPGGRTWPLPMYELALNTSAWLSERRVSSVPLLLVSPEPRPLAMFGRRASSEVASLLRTHGIEFVSGHAIRHHDDRLLLAGGQRVEADIAIALSRLAGPGIDGLPRDAEGFIVVDERGRVRGLDAVFAAGDATSFPFKQGGLATQQGDAIARALAFESGVDIADDASALVLRAVLFSGTDRRYLLAELGDRLEETSQASREPLWPEPSKLVGRYLAPYLETLSADRVGSPRSA